MIPQTSKELLEQLTPLTEATVTVAREFQNLQAKRPTKFLLKKIYHENGKHTYVWRWEKYFVVMENDQYGLFQQKQLEQLKMDF
jgi:hypothetical protein